MNGDWLPWSTGMNGNRPATTSPPGATSASDSPAPGRPTPLWVWNPITHYAAPPRCATLPWRAQVDWLAVDGYNWGNTRAWGWQSYADIRRRRRPLERLAPGGGS